MIGNENGGKREAYPPLINFCLISERTVNLELIFVFFIKFFLKILNQWLYRTLEEKKKLHFAIKFTSKSKNCNLLFSAYVL